MDGVLQRAGHGLRLGVAFSLLVFLCGCARDVAALRPFDFATDTFAYENELVWEYHHDGQSGATTVSRRDPPPHYSHHCFVVSRAARQFFEHARFDPASPVADARTYRRIIRSVVGRSARRGSRAEERVVVPGYGDLRSFSGDWEWLLKEQCGGAWQSYAQRGHWRMIFPFTRGQQRRMADALVERLKTRPQIAHVVRFPQLTINHALLVYEVRVTGTNRVFLAYDPNDVDKPTELIFDGDWFRMGRNGYFRGGRVNAYAVYEGWCY